MRPRFAVVAACLLLAACREGARYVAKGLKYAAPTGPRIEQILVDDPLLLRTPIVRAGGRATVGFAPETWTAWLAEAAPR